MESFVSIGAGHDEISYYKSIIDDSLNKAEAMPYAERRAYEMNTNDDEDYTIEGTLHRPSNLFVSVLIGLLYLLYRGGCSRYGGDLQQREGDEGPGLSRQSIV